MKGIIMRTIIPVLLLLLLTGCKDTGQEQTKDQGLNIRFTLVDGRLWADFRTPILPEDDNVRCEFTLVVRNESHTVALDGAQIPNVEVFRATGMQRIGIVQLYSTWDGNLAAGETDTVQLIKRTMQGPTLVPIPCDSLITYKIALMRGSDILGLVRRDSVLFGCYH
jgi:hypothetical protein